MTLGTADPTLVQTIAPDGAWAVLCQPRADTNGDGRIAFLLGDDTIDGDAVFSWLVIGEGAGRRIDGFVDSDPTGQFIVFVWDDVLILQDTLTLKETVLADRVSEIPPDQRMSLASFAERAPALLHVSWKGREVELKIRQLETGVERVVGTGKGRWAAATITPLGNSVDVERAPANDNHEGKLMAASGWGSVRPPCSTFKYPYPHFYRGGDSLERVIVALDGKEIKAGPEAVAIAGGAIDRDNAGQVVLLRVAAPDTVLSQPGCVSERLIFDEVSGAALIRDCNGESQLARIGSPLLRLSERPLVDLQALNSRIVGVVSDKKELTAWDISNRERVDVDQLLGVKLREPWELVAQWQDGFVVWGLAHYVGVLREPDGTWRAQVWPGRFGSAHWTKHLPSGAIRFPEGRIGLFGTPELFTVRGDVETTRGTLALVAPARSNPGPLIWREMVKETSGSGTTGQQVP